MSLLSVGKTKDTTDVVLYHPVSGEPLLNGDKTQMSITIHGPYSARYKKISHEQQNRRLIKAQRSGGKLNLTAEEIEASALEILVKCVESWHVTLDKDLEKFSEDKVREVFVTLPWVREQVDAAFGDARAFLE
jgi:hypothetical protein